MFNQIQIQSELTKTVMSVDDLMCEADKEVCSVFNFFCNYKESLFLCQEVMWTTIKINFYAMIFATYYKYDSLLVEKFLKSFDDDNGIVSLKNKSLVYANLFALSRKYKQILSCSQPDLCFVISFTGLLKGFCSCYPSYKLLLESLFFDLYDESNINSCTKFAFHPVTSFFKDSNNL
ncbi:MAG: hypothetical protein V3575_05985 [Candidatus Absconditabacteria bacterium]